jgi:hypothetical protein
MIGRGAIPSQRSGFLAGVKAQRRIHDQLMIILVTTIRRNERAVLEGEN